MPSCLKSLPEREFISGLAEVVKYGIIKDLDLFEILENNSEAILAKDAALLTTIIQRCCQIKMDIVQNDEKEEDSRAILNLGHTFAHALEAATHYMTYLHGEAVSIGISCAFYLSCYLGFIDNFLIQRLHDLLQKLKLPAFLPDIPPAEILIDHMYGDKKTVHGQLNFIIVKNMGHVEKLTNVQPEVILAALKQT